MAPGTASGSSRDTAEIENSLLKIFVNNPNFEQLEDAFNAFCPFEAIGMVRQEIRHGYFLSYILDPQRPHGFGSACLRVLVSTAAVVMVEGDEDQGQGRHFTPLDAHLMDLEPALVRREWRNIDILVEIPSEKLVLAVELKIDANEHSAQLQRYRREVEGNWPAKEGWRYAFLFLTKRGDAPTEDSGKGWLSLELESLATGLGSVVANQKGSVDARAMLSSYISMLRRHHLSNEYLEEIAEKLWAHHRDALDFLMDRRPNAIGDLFRELHQKRESLAADMSSACGLRVIPDDSPVRMLRFAVSEWDQLPGFLKANWTSSSRLLLIEIEKGSGDRPVIRMRFALGPGDTDARRAIYDTLKQAGVELGRRKGLSAEWTRLASINIIQLSDEAGFDQNAVLNKISDGAVRFAKSYVSNYDKALRSIRISKK